MEIIRVIDTNNNGVIIFWVDGSSSSVPLDGDSRELAAYQDWVGKGNSAEPLE